ncbi:ABC transporter ATP-binding protein [soil metagenome]
MARIDLHGISKRYAANVALHPTDLAIADGEFLTLLGPSGCGKTTTLRIVAGFVKPTSGHVAFDGDRVTHLPPYQRDIGMVFQDYALFPHLTIEDNIGFSLRERGQSRDDINRRVRELLELIQLPDVAKRLPNEISGGQQQRVAFARAVAHPPRVLLMDEPLSALDLKLREGMQLELRRLQRSLGITTIYVTHDQGEAMYLSDRIAVMHQGSVAQLGSARDIYDRPNSRFVAEFVGQINVLPVELASHDGAFDVLRTGDVSLRAPSGNAQRESLLAVRPQHLSIARGGIIPDGHNTLGGRVVSQVFTGNLVHIQVQTQTAHWTVETRPAEEPVAEGAHVTLHWNPADSVVLAA